jgi:hypothetical protein
MAWILRWRPGAARAASAVSPRACRRGRWSVSQDRGDEALRVVPVAVSLSGGTGNAWASPQAAETPRRLVFEGGFVVDGGRDRRLEERAWVLGFEDLRGYLQARCDAGTSVPRIAAELGAGTGRCRRR